MPEFSVLQEELKEKEESLQLNLSENIEDDVLTYALFPQIAIKFFKNRDNPSAFEPHPDNDRLVSESREDQQEAPSVYSVEVNGERFIVRVSEEENPEVTETKKVETDTQSQIVTGNKGEIKAPLGGNVFKINVSIGDIVRPGDVVLILEAMKMETEIQASVSGHVASILVQEGDAVDMDQSLISIA